MGSICHRWYEIAKRSRAALAWLALLLLMAALVGTACAFFLWSLDEVTRLRFQFPWMLFLLPFGGFAVGYIYHRWGDTAERGTSLIVEQIHEPGGGVPRRMAPLVLLGTLVTHLFGGSAGREGTAVQMGGSLAGAVGRIARLDGKATRILLMAGVAAGFGAVFGTPIAGTIFALEVVMISRVPYAALIPCFIAAVAADWICHAWGVHHTLYSVTSHSGDHRLVGFIPTDLLLFGKVLLAAVAIGLVSRSFVIASHRLTAVFRRTIPYAPLRPAIGGVLIIGLFFLAGTPDYLGLGVLPQEPSSITLPSFFASSESHPWSWLWKLVFTVVTLSAGFKGGEVTPLFFIGAGLGNALAWGLGAPPDLFAGLGFVAIFAGASKTPIASTILGLELFGATHTVYLATACFVAYACSGNSGIYHARGIAMPKFPFMRNRRGE